MVTGYHDEASGTMVEATTAAHPEASQRCFIAASMAFPVRHEPQVTAQP